MAKPKVYLESSVISFYANRRSKDLVVAAYQEISADWWENELHKYQPYVSQFVLEEISRGDSRAAQNRMDAIKTFPLLELPEEVFDLAQKYLKEVQIPRKSQLDAFHISAAVVNGMDYILSWNFHHIANVFVKQKIQRINESLGVETPIICTPEELIENEGDKYEK
jgi:hypothetical protein